MSGDCGDDLKPIRLIVQGAATEPGAGDWLKKALSTNAASSGYRYLGEMGDWLSIRKIKMPPAFYRLRSYHLLIMTDTDVFGLIASLIQQFGDRNRLGHIEVIEPDFLMHLSKPSTQLGTRFDLYATKATHTTYRAHLKIPAKGSGEPTGSGVKVAVIDTGVEPNILATHPQKFCDLFTPDNSNHVDGFGHGTAMIAIIKDVAPDADVYAVRVTDNENVRLWDVMAGISTAAYVIDADIINLSLGCVNVNQNCGVCGGQGSNRSTVFETLIKSIGGHGGRPDPVFVTAVGNDGHANGFDWPARYAETLAVAALTSGKERSSFSNGGTSKSAYVLCPGGDWDTVSGTAKEWVGEGVDGQNTTYCVGTSPATAYASGVLCLYREHFLTSSKSLSASALLDKAMTRCVRNDISPVYDKGEHGEGRLVFDSSP